MDQAAERVGGDLYILPSSIHEVLLVRDDGTFDRDHLADMVKEINETRVAPEDLLKSQLKAIYKDNADTIIGNMDSQLFLGGTEPTTLKDLSQALGKETIDMYSTGESRGNNPSYSMNYQKSSKDLMTVDELAVMDGDKCILQLRGVRPFMSDKTFEQLEKDGIFVFPEIIKDADDISRNQMVLQSVNDMYASGNVMGFLGAGNQRLVIESRFSAGEDYLFQYSN